MLPNIARAIQNFRGLIISIGFGAAFLHSLGAATLAAAPNHGSVEIAPAGRTTPYYPFKNFIADTHMNPILKAAILNPSSAGLVFALPWSVVQPTCGAFTFSSDVNDILGYLAANLRADQMIWPGIGSGASAPACLENIGVPTVPIYYAFGNQSGQPCVLYNMPLMSSPTYGALYAAAVRAMLSALSQIPVASGGTLADRVAGINLGAYGAVSSELQMPSRGCSVESVHQSRAQQTALWAAAGYKGSQALTTYAAILQDILTDPALRQGAMVLQSTTGGDGWSFPQPAGAIPVLEPMLEAATQTWANRFVISWDLVSELGAPPPAQIVAAARNGTRVALEFNSTATGFTTSCRGILANGSTDPVTATPACFDAMQARNIAAIPSPLVLWQVEPADYGIRGFFPQH